VSTDSTLSYGTLVGTFLNTTTNSSAPLTIDFDVMWDGTIFYTTTSTSETCLNQLSAGSGNSKTLWIILGIIGAIILLVIIVAVVIMVLKSKKKDGGDDETGQVHQPLNNWEGWNRK